MRNPHGINRRDHPQGMLPPRPRDTIKTVRRDKDRGVAYSGPGQNPGPYEDDDPYIPKPTWRCRFLGHKFYRWEIIDQWSSRSKIRQSHCVWCGIEYME